MNFEILFNEAVAMYPNQIDISDGKLFEEDDTGFLSKNFNKACEDAENKASLLAEWHTLLVWIISQVMHENARKSFIDNKFLITPEIDRKRFRFFLINNLEQEDYKDMRMEFLKYEQLNGAIA